ncbi:MAG TPA: hypothetical protein VHE59_10490 [Mucilaginibacter sp.]|nr:hypothetical protein [Mucilaginibacter sp.]
MPKSTKRFILSNDKLNSHGFRVLTRGIDLTDFRKNPVMYWMHDYPKSDNGDKEKGLPIGYWDDIQITDTELSAVPVFDDNDEFAMKLYHKVEHGTIRAASVAIEPVQLDTNKANWLPGQKLPTLVKSRLDEASIVDRGSNRDAVTMSAGSTVYLKLSENAFNNLDIEKNMNQTPVNTPQGDFSPELLDIMQNAIQAGKLTKDQADNMLKIANNSQEVEVAVKKAIRTQPINPDNIRGKFHHTLIDVAANKSYDEIQKSSPGTLIDLAEVAPALYKAKFFEKHGRLPAALPKRNP